MKNNALNPNHDAFLLIDSSEMKINFGGLLSFRDKHNKEFWRDDELYYILIGGDADNLKELIIEFVDLNWDLGHRASIFIFAVIFSLFLYLLMFFRQKLTEIFNYSRRLVVARI